MKPYLEMTTEELTQELDTLKKEYKKVIVLSVFFHLEKWVSNILMLLCLKNYA